MSKRDFSFEALVDVTGADLGSLTDTERGRINRALAELRVLVGDDYILHTLIHDKAKAWKIAYPEIPLTPQALTGSWSSIEEKAKETERSQQQPVNMPSSRSKQVRCPTCDGDGVVLFSVRPSTTNPRSGFEEYAPCPDCSDADASFWRYDGSRFTPPTQAEVRARLGS